MAVQKPHQIIIVYPDVSTKIARKVVTRTAAIGIPLSFVSDVSQVNDSCHDPQTIVLVKSKLAEASCSPVKQINPKKTRIVELLNLLNIDESKPNQGRPSWQSTEQIFESIFLSDFLRLISTSDPTKNWLNQIGWANSKITLESDTSRFAGEASKLLLAMKHPKKSTPLRIMEHIAQFSHELTSPSPCSLEFQYDGATIVYRYVVRASYLSSRSTIECFLQMPSTLTTVMHNSLEGTHTEILGRFYLCSEELTHPSIVVFGDASDLGKGQPLTRPWKESA